jgi:hypothetical protein
METNFPAHCFFQALEADILRNRIVFLDFIHRLVSQEQN